MEIYEYTALELVNSIKERKLTCREAVEAYINRIEAVEPSVGALITKNYENARLRADELDKALNEGKDIGPLGGAVYLMKDLICTKGVATTCSSKILEDFIAPYSAFIYERLYDAGAIMIAKADLDEFAMGATGRNSSFNETKNPYDLTRIPGGSSSGSAAGLAAGMGCFAIGTDTGGSVRQPASFCNLTGIKPTYGSVSRYGLVAFASSLDQAGVLAKTAADSALVLQVIAGYDPKDSTCIEGGRPDYSSLIGTDIKGMKIGVDRSSITLLKDEAVIKAFERTIEKFAELGAEIIDVNFKYINYAVPAYYLIACSEASSNLARFDGVRYTKREKVEGGNVADIMKQSRSRLLGPEVKKRIMLGTYALSAGYYDKYYNKALKMRRMIVEDMNRIYEKCDCYLCPTSPVVPYKYEQTLTDKLTLYTSDIFTVTANLCGGCAMSFQAGFSEEGLPIGMQLYGAPMKEAELYRAVAAFEKVEAYYKITPEGLGE